MYIPIINIKIQKRVYFMSFLTKNTGNIIKDAAFEGI